MPRKKTPIGKVLLAHRNRLGLTLREAGLKTDVDFSFLSRVEAGVSIPSVTILEAIAEGYRLTVQGILEEAGIR